MLWRLDRPRLGQQFNSYTLHTSSTNLFLFFTRTMFLARCIKVETFFNYCVLSMSPLQMKVEKHQLLARHITTLIRTICLIEPNTNVGFLTVFYNGYVPPASKDAHKKVSAQEKWAWTHMTAVFLHKRMQNECVNTLVVFFPASCADNFQCLWFCLDRSTYRTSSTRTFRLLSKALAH